MCKTYSSLKELQSSLILRDLEQFHHSLLIGCMSSNFLDDVSDELGVFRKFLLTDLQNVLAHEDEREEMKI